MPNSLLLTPHSKCLQTKAETLLSEVAAYAIEDDLPADMAEQHDHYLYGVSKK
jgi:hypothetical protein